MNQRVAASNVTPVALVALISIGAIGGASVRWAAIETFGSGGGDGGWPWAIIVLNALGALILGTILTPRSATGDATRLRLAVGTGFCGALTTFSTFAVDVAEFVRGDEASATGTSTGLAVVGVSFASGVAAFVVGRRLASRRLGNRAAWSAR